MAQVKRITVVLPYRRQPWFERVQQDLLGSPLVREIFVVNMGGFKPAQGSYKGFEAPSIGHGPLWNHIIGQTRTGYLLLIQDHAEIEWSPGALARLVDVAETTKAGMVYGDYHEMHRGRRQEHPVNDYQTGSIRDDFQFGPARLISVSAARSALKKYGAIPELFHAGLYDLRLKLSVDYPLFHLQEYLYTKMDGVAAGLCNPENEVPDGPPDQEKKHFAYVDPRHQAGQREMEAAATAHLKRIGAWLKPVFKEVPPSGQRFPAEASVIIPVYNRRRTITDAVQSALSQKTDFTFNVIVVDNRSTDGTTAVLSRLARKFPAVNHLIPARSDLGIGGCWNEGVFSACCGRYAVQLDSDDLYGSDRSLQQIVDLFRSCPYAAVIGAYTLVNERMEEIPPGLIDHKEWTDDNGRNNALRINGLGAPRAFQTALLRKFGFLNVSYGEDYAMVLRLLREYHLGRIYESLYLCRRWPGNTDAGLSVEKANRNDAFKDKIRTLEILARQSLNRKSE
jgi:hypothetical protein